MTFDQKKFSKSVEQSRDIFDKFIYRPENGDTLADMIQPGYFAASRFANDTDWTNSIIEAQGDDGYAQLQIDENGDAINLVAQAVQSIEQQEIGNFATAAEQIPAGTGEANKIRINFGAGGNTTGNEFTLSPDGTLTCNSNSVQYRFQITLRIGRTGGAGVSIILGRAMYAADGIEANAVQIASTFAIEIDDGDTIWREVIKADLSPAIGSKLWFELARDEAGNNSGQILTVQPTGTLAAAGWLDSSSASLQISKKVAA